LSRKWTEEEENLCEKLYKSGKNYEEIGKILNRTKWSIKSKCFNKENICDYCNSNNKVYFNNRTGKMLCSKHRRQILRNGKILKRTMRDKNDYEIKKDELGEYAEIILRNRQHEEIGRSLIDLEDLEYILKIKWYLDIWKYAASGNSQHIIPDYTTMQNYILKYNNTIDHIDRNRLNNRKYNLRKSTKQLNARNKSKRSNNKSGTIGVAWNKRDCNWESYISVNHKKINLGQYDNINDAIKIRLQAEVKYFGEYAPQKHLYEQYNIKEGE
jgi:hypothetical protein